MPRSETRAETATVLFTDLVDSTGLRRKLGDDRADEVRRAHDRVLSEAIAARGGSEVKGTGDGVMAVFPAAGEGVAAAVAMQQAIDRWARRAGIALEIRVGLSAGDVVWEDNDCFGTPVVEARRLCDAAGGQQILVSDIVRALAGTRGGHQFSPAGSLDLKGLGQPVIAHTVVWSAPTTGTPLPPALSATETVDFVGRVQQRELLTAAWKESLGGTRRIALLSGEPGVGKTRMATEMAHMAHAEGCTVLFGRCDEELGVPYQPFVEALRYLFSAVPPEDLSDHLGPYGGDLARLVPDLDRLAPALAEPLLADPETERYRLFEAVDGCLAASAQMAPVVLVVDDIHWAAKPTLLLLRHLARSPVPSRLLVIATYRDTELGRGHPLAEVLADLRREAAVQRVDLPGLDGGEVEAFLEAVAGYSLDDEGIELARLVHAETEGNPFFVGQVLRHLVESGALVQQDGRWVRGPAADAMGIPEGVREVIGRRLSRLPEESNQVLDIAAVIGREFDDRLLVEAAEVGEEAVFDALERAERARLIQGVPGSRGRHAFVHALVRSTLYEELTTTRRLRLHRRIAQSLEARGGADSPAGLAELAHHYCEAASLGEVEKAVQYASEAARAAHARLAFEEAVDFYQRALSALDADDRNTWAQRTELLIELAGEWYGLDAEACMRTAGEAFQLARDLGRSDLLGRAAISRGGKRQWGDAGVVDEQLVEMLEEALSALGPGDDPIRACVVARLASELYFAPGSEVRRRDLADEGVAMARRLGDPETLAFALACSCWGLWTPHNADVRLEIAREIVALGEASGNKELAYSGYGWLQMLHLEMLHADESEAALARLGAIGEELGQPPWRWWPVVGRCTRMLLDGRFDEARRLADEALALTERSGSVTPLQLYGVQQIALRRALGGLEEMEPLTAAMVEQFPTIPAWRTGLAYLYAELGRLGEAREQFEVLAQDDFADIPDDANWMVGVALSAFVCHRLGDRDRAAILYELLGPYSGRAVLVGPPADCWGSVARIRALLAATLERWDAWEQHLADATVEHQAIRARSWLAIQRYEEATILAARDREGDVARARVALNEALAEFRDMGMDRMAQLAGEFSSRLA